MKKIDIKDDLASIRNLMERSSKFISLSGLSGVLAGVYALIGAGYAYKLLFTGPSRTTYYFAEAVSIQEIMATNIGTLVYVALAVLVASITTGIVLSYKKAQRKGQSILNPTSKQLLFHMLTPLLAGGILMLILLTRGYFGVIAPASLIFYGLALVGASNFTFTDVKYLGLLEIALGLISALYPGYGLYFWAIGFGVLHIIYGSVMYFKYDR
ncbi:MAG: hypothetical protein V4619_12000 [Bacteroidota bacterium]